jgi:hypothetical protein
MAKFNQAQNYPNQQLATLLSALGMTPHDTASSGTSTQQTTTPTDWAGIAESALGAAGDIFAGKSDRRIKKNISKIGVNAPTGLPVFSYNFKGEQPGMPKTIGPMAQDIQKVMPAAVAPHPTTGVLHVAKPVLGALSSPSSLIPNQKAAKKALVNPRAGARAGVGALANTRRRMPPVLGALSG